MRNLLALLGAMVVAFAVVGWYRGWYTVENESGKDGHEAVNIEINRGRISEDLHKGGERIHEALEKGHKEEPAKPAETGSKELLPHSAVPGQIKPAGKE